MGLPQGSEWILIVIVVVLLFGAKKLPEAARGLGRSLRIFKSEVKHVNDPLDESEGGSTAVTPAAIAPAPIVKAPIVQAPIVQAPIAPPPVQAPAQAGFVPIQSAPAVETTSTADSTNVQSVTEHFYGPERSDR